MLKLLILIFIFQLIIPVKSFADKNVNELINILKTGNNVARINASKELVKKGTSIENQLLKLLETEEDKVKMSIIWILGEWGKKKYLNYLLTFIGGELDIARRAIVALGKIRDPLAIPYLVKKLRAKSRYIRTDTVYSLGKIGGHDAFAHILTVQDDADWHVREAVAIALGEIGILEGREPLKLMADNDPDPLIRIAAKDSLKLLREKH